MFQATPRTLLPAGEQKNTASAPNSSGVVNCIEGSFSPSSCLVASRVADALGGGLGVHLLLHQRCQHPAGADGVAGHAGGGVFQRGDLGQAHHAVLGGDIGRFFGRTHQAVDAGHVDDAAPVFGQHAGQGQAGGVEGAAHVDGDDGVPFFDREVLDPRHVLNARVVDQNVQAAEGGLRMLDHVLNLGGLAHVGTVVAHLHAQRGDLGLGAFHVTKAIEHDVGALGGQALAMPKPMPLVEPVTRAVLPLSMVGPLKKLVSRLN